MGVHYILLLTQAFHIVADSGCKESSLSELSKDRKQVRRSGNNAPENTKDQRKRPAKMVTSELWLLCDDVACT